MEITTIGIDLAKHVLPVHGVDAGGVMIVRKALRRAQMLPFSAKLSPCLVCMEACGSFGMRSRAAGEQIAACVPPSIARSTADHRLPATCHPFLQGRQ